MFKRFVCIILSTVMLLLISSPVFAVPVDTAPLSAPAEPVTMESILNDFHAQSLSTDGQDSATIKQNTINQLTEAGYSAYDLNPATLSSLENSLNTDFSAMGLDPEGSYLIIVSGEGQPSAEISPITPPSGDASVCGFGDGVLLPPIHQYDPDHPVYDNSFYYSYDGDTYLMRYLTVAATDNSGLGDLTPIELLDVVDTESIANLLDYSILLLSGYIPISGTVGTILSLFTSILPYWSPAQTTSLIYIAGTTWIHTYTQIYDDSNSWNSYAFVEHANLTHSFTYTYIDSTNSIDPVYDTVTSEKTRQTIYSEHYNDSTWRKEQAVVGYMLDQCVADRIGIVHYMLNQNGEYLPLIAHTSPN